MRRISILGATGSIGRSTLEVIQKFPDRFGVTALTANANISLLGDQVSRFRPDLAVVGNKEDMRELENRLPAGIKTDIVYGEKGYIAAAVHDRCDTVVSAMVGAAGLLPTIAAVNAGKQVALANKEALVMAGDLVMARAREKNITIRPIDSEHSAIFQCLAGNRRRDLRRIYLTASGGPFRSLPAAAFADITPADALAHPTWQMGNKISIDSATMMNKGLEVIEAKHLFNIDHKDITMVIHPQSIIHSMVLFADGSVMAQMGLPDMKGAIAYALAGPERLPLELSAPDFAALGRLTFEAPDVDRFPCLTLAERACEAGGTMPAVLNAANEAAVGAFLDHRISFVQISQVIAHVMDAHEPIVSPDMEAILSADQWARQTAEEWMNRNGKELPA
jgi:1-deoxy-D-xylulose-5-phosphate reductoisomerase